MRLAGEDLALERAGVGCVVAVVVRAVEAHLVGPGEHVVARVVAVPHLGGEAVCRLAGGDRVSVGAEAVAVAVRVERRGVNRLLVDLAVAVVVEAVAALLGTGVHGGVRVVAVDVGWGAVGVGVGRGRGAGVVLGAGMAGEEEEKGEVHQRLHRVPDELHSFP